ncbi:MAG: hypothetical protein U0559_00295 [Anaerolineae bacterium]
MIWQTFDNGDAMVQALKVGEHPDLELNAVPNGAFMTVKTTPTSKRSRCPIDHLMN